MKEFFFINVGQIGIMCSVLLVVMRIQRALDAWDEEHEQLMDWMCEERQIEKSKLPTRRKKKRFLFGVIPWQH